MGTYISSAPKAGFPNYRESCLLEDPAHDEAALTMAYSSPAKVSGSLEQTDLLMALTGAEHAGALCLCFVGGAHASWVVSAMRNSLHGEVVAIICHHFMLLVGVPMVPDNFTLWEGKDSVGRVLRVVGVSVLEDVRESGWVKPTVGCPKLVVATPAVSGRVE